MSPPPGPRPAAEGWRSAVPWGSAVWEHQSLAALFRRLATGFEDGGARAGVLRLAEPVRIGVSGPGADAYRGFAAAYATLLARETGIDIAQAPQGSSGNLSVQLVVAESARLPPGARCLHLPRRIAWRDYRGAAARFQAEARETAGTVEAATVFIAAGLPPAAIRSCILEEIPQAMGLGNDVPLLGPTIFNDDGAHLWPTGLDLLMLRLLYAPEIVPGMAPVEAEKAAGRALRRQTPGSVAGPTLPLPPRGTSLRFARALAAADKLSGRPSGRSTNEEIRAVLGNLRTAAPASGPGAAQARCTIGLLTHRLAGSGGTAADRLALTASDCRAAEATSWPGPVPSRRPPGPRTLRLAIAEAEALLAAGRPADALTLLDRTAPGLAALGNDAGLAQLHRLRSAALSDMGRNAAPARALADAWARYALGGD
ncbi:MAG: DUF2927 domain-containing protein [Pseudomonadota bacterium]